MTLIGLVLEGDANQLTGRTDEGYGGVKAEVEHQDRLRLGFGFSLG
jgi:uncharacterized protein YjbJ (UPF0337 family)